MRESGSLTLWLALFLVSLGNAADRPAGRAESEGESTPPTALSVGVGKLTAKFKRVDPATYKIRYPAFYMLETEVTNALYKEYLSATEETKDDTKVLRIIEERASGKRPKTTASVSYSVGDKTGLWKKNQYPKGRGEHPVALVTLSDAQQFCKWLTIRNPKIGLFRLPTWNEWMVAAYGLKRSYPWGNEWKTNRVHMSFGFINDFVTREGKSAWVDERPKRTEEVRARPQGRTPEGLYGMLGNVEEYIAEGDPTDRNYFNLGSRWMGGGFESGWDWDPKKNTAVSPRQDYWGYGHHRTNRCADLGFRVVLDTKSDLTLLKRKRLFDQKDRAWMLESDTE